MKFPMIKTHHTKLYKAQMCPGIIMVSLPGLKPCVVLHRVTSLDCESVQGILRSGAMLSNTQLALVLHAQAQWLFSDILLR